MAAHSDASSKLYALWQSFAQTRSEEIRGKLIESYMPLARIIAAKAFALRSDHSVSFEDYLQYGRVGLMEAVDRYDLSRNVSFEAYAMHRIRGAILSGIGQESELAAQREFWRTRVPERLESLVGSMTVRPESASLEDLIDVTVGLALGLVLDSEADPVDDTVQANPYAATELAQLVSLLRRCVERLPEREREIVEGHYFRRSEFQSIAQQFALTKGRVSQLHARALKLLREMIVDAAKLDRKL